MAAGRSTFAVKRGDELIRVFVDGDEATFVVASIDSVGVVIEAINRAVAAGARRGTLFTGEVVNDQVAAMHEMRSRTDAANQGNRVVRSMTATMTDAAVTAVPPK